MEFFQSTLEEITESERQMLLTGKEREAARLDRHVAALRIRLHLICRKDKPAFTVIHAS